MKKKTIVTIAILTAIVISVWSFFREEPLLDANLSLPLEAKLGNSITMTVTATNNHSKTVVLDSIDISDSFIAGFQVVSINPHPIDSFGSRCLEPSGRPDIGILLTLWGGNDRCRCRRYYRFSFRGPWDKVDPIPPFHPPFEIHG